jgi:hypothetical protein
LRLIAEPVNEPLATIDLSSADWDTGESICRRVSATIPPSLPPGEYQLVVQLGDRSTPVGRIPVR